jgi:Flavodoxin domain
MRSLVVYESSFGNTREIAEEIALALSAAGDTELVSVDVAPPSLARVDLLVIGAPTHVHGLSSKRSREGAQEQGANGEVGIGVRGWIDELPLSGRPRVAVFDTRVRKPELLTGSAAHSMVRRLRRRGYRMAAEPQSFFVGGTPGPLEHGELERAAKWAKELASEVMSAAA